MSPRARGPRFLAPEVIQTSAMDCGPASLKCLLEGFGIPVSYGRLREACQTDLDGTSIDTLEDVARGLGLDAEQVMLPPDQVLLPGACALPALVVVRLPNGVTHFVVAWRKLGDWVQVMDPGVGRRWVPARTFLEQLYLHATPVPAAAWREWAGSDEALSMVRLRLREVAVPGPAGQALIDAATADPSWRSLAALDAALRMTAALVRSEALGAGAEAARALCSFVEKARGPGDPSSLIPAAYWSVLPLAGEGEEQLRLRGAVLVRVRGRQEAPSGDRPLSPELSSALSEAPVRPVRELFGLLREDGLLEPLALLGALGAAALAALCEALLFRGLLDLGQTLGMRAQRLELIGALVAFLLALALVELPIASGLLSLGRAVEGRLRLAFLRKIPRLYDRYFQSRLTSDMAERCHNLHAIRAAPGLGGNLVRTGFELLVTTAGLVWLAPESLLLALGAATAAVALPLLFQPVLHERELQMRTHGGALSRFYLDALLGIVAIRAHGAERSVRQGHESLSVEWARSGRRLLSVAVLAEAAAAGVGLTLAALLVGTHLERSAAASGSVLLVAYWALQLPVLGERLALLFAQYPAQRNVLLRLLEPLGAPEAELGPDEHGQRGSVAPGTPPVAISLRGVGVVASGHTLLEDLTLSVAPGEHLAIVGPSGAGKSSLLGLLLGWHRPASGGVEVDGAPLDPAGLDRLRRQTAWVDPGVQLWNRSLLSNLLYGGAEAGASAVGPAVEAAELVELLQRLPDGLMSSVGEGGALLSGGEGQRVRLGRALVRPGVRLVLLDEPFRGLEGSRRRELLAKARHLWREATLLCVTHDLSETLTFPRVVVLAGGRVVEDGSPEELAKDPSSHYRRLLDAEQAVHGKLLSAASWRRLRLEQGVMLESAGGAEREAAGG